MRPECPRRVPLVTGAPVEVDAGCLDSGGSLVPLTSGRCRSALWSVMGRPTNPAFPGHIVVSAAYDDSQQCAWPHEKRGNVADDALLGPKRRQAVSFGQVRWYGQAGQLVLAPPYFAGGGPAGDHLEFCFRTHGVGYAITLHSWSPLAQVVATLKLLVRSALGK
jgi:hypothetical protein